MNQPIGLSLYVIIRARLLRARERIGMHRVWVTVMLPLLVSGCSASSSGPPQGSLTASATPPVPSQSAVTPWYSVADGCPGLTGQKRITDGLRGQPNGFDDATSYDTTCVYESGSVDSINVSIDRVADPARPAQERLRFAESVSRSAGHLVLPLPGFGDDAIAVVNPNVSAADPTVAVTIRSRNALLDIRMRTSTPIRGEADLASHSAELKAVCDDVLDDLRP